MFAWQPNRSMLAATVIPALAYPGGPVWTFSQTVAGIDPAEWGGTLA